MTTAMIVAMIMGGGGGRVEGRGGGPGGCFLYSNDYELVRTYDC